MPVTELCLTLTGNEMGEIDCRASDVILKPGANTVLLIFDVFMKSLKIGIFKWREIYALHF